MTKIDDLAKAYVRAMEQEQGAAAALKRAQRDSENAQSELKSATTALQRLVTENLVKENHRVAITRGAKVIILDIQGNGVRIEEYSAICADSPHARAVAVGD